MSRDTLERFILLPNLKLGEAYDLGGWGIGFNAKKTTTREICPGCATPSSSIYDHRTVRIKDEPIRGKAVFVKIKKRRFRCQNRDCKRVFTEPVEGIGKKARTTHRFKKGLTWACQKFRTLKEVQKQYRCGSRMVYESFYSLLEHYRKRNLYPLPRIIGLDEHSIRKPKYRDVEYATIVVDHKNHKVYELIDGKTVEALSVAFENIPGKDNVEVVTIDLSETFRAFVRKTFVNASIVADRFHVQRLFNKLVNRYRKKATGDDRKNPIRKLLLRDGAKLARHEHCALKRWLNHYPDIREIYEMKEAVARFYRIRGVAKAKRALAKLLDRMGHSKLPKVASLRRTLLAWKDEILGFFRHHGVSNGRTEGFNRVGKLVQRTAFGIKNFNNYRLRLLNHCY